MTLGQQIFWGSLFLGLCLVIQVFFLALCANMLPRVTSWFKTRRAATEVVGVLLFTLGVIVSSLTVQVWIWAWAWIVYDILPDWNTAVYFSLVTFTALGYGDIVLGPEVRVFASFGSVTGLLSFGVSTAFLVAMMGRFTRDLPSNHSKGENNRARGAP